jgi:outer membrane protein assembly factor BamB
MTIDQTNQPTPRKPLRLWPGVVIVFLQGLIRFVLPVVAPDAQIFGADAGIVAILAGPAGLLAMLVWWLFFSRARWSERLGAIGVMIVAVIATWPLMHRSIQNGMMGNMFFAYAVPVSLTVAFVGWAVASRRLSGGPRFAAMVAAILLACGVWTLARTNGVLGAGSDLAWRWTPTAEERLLAQVGNEPASLPPAPAAAAPVTPNAPAASTAAPDARPAETPKAAQTPKEQPVAKAGDEPSALSATAPNARNKPGAPSLVDAAPAAWPGFRGPGRDSVIHGVRIETDWSKSPPVALWRRPIGPGWSSFAVRGDLLYTQEQRGDEEMVSAYNLTTGKPVWMHRDATRFWESNGGAGPRGTPAVSGGRVYTLGATGILNALDAGNGAVGWSRNVGTDTSVEVPGWGFASSPLVVNDVVVVAASGRLAAYEVTTGQPRWFGPTGGAGYSSPHLATIDGVPQVLLLRGSRTISVAPADGTLLWEHTWLPGVSIVQPAVIADGDVLINSADAMGGNGIRRLAVARGPAGWKVEERWTSRGLKPYFNDLVVHKGHAFGFDGNILSCIDLADGTRKWKGGRYGNGQLVLLADQDVLLVLSEEGELALVSATPDQFTELAHVPALNSKTWNHPVLVGDVLLVRNDHEMAAFRLSLTSR